jgi:hypothetical protein
VMIVFIDIFIIIILLPLNRNAYPKGKSVVPADFRKSDF